MRCCSLDSLESVFQAGNMVLSRLPCSMGPCFFAACFFMAICWTVDGAVTVSVGIPVPDSVYYKEKNEVVITCNYTKDTESLASVQWQYGQSTIVSNYDVGLLDLTYPSSPAYGPPAYVMSTDSIDSTTNLKILSAKESDRGDYTCRVRFIVPGSGLAEQESVGKLEMFVKAKLENIGGVIGELLKVQANSGPVNITIQVRDIYPEATFSWKLGADPISNFPTESKEDQEGLFTCNSTATFTPKILDNGKNVTCGISLGNQAPLELVIAQLSVTGPPPTTSSTTPDSGAPPIPQGCTPWPCGGGIGIGVGLLVLFCVVGLTIYYCCKNNEDPDPKRGGGKDKGRESLPLDESPPPNKV